MEREYNINASRYFSTLEKYARRYRNMHFEELGLKGNQYFIIMYVSRHPGVTQEVLVQKTLMDKGNLARQVSQLETDGYITRTPDPLDRRNMNICVTEKGEQAAAYIRKTLSQWNDRLLEGLSQEDEQRLNSILTVMIDNARNAIEGD